MSNNLPFNEGEVVSRLVEGDMQAFDELYWKYQKAVYRNAFKFTQDVALAEDIVQEVFISLWQRRETVNAILSPKYYFLRAIKNKVLKSLHKNVRKVTSEHLQDEYDFSHEFSIERVIIDKQISEEKAERLRKTLSLLSKRQIEIIYLKYYQYLDHGQIAELMNISRQSVYNLLHEAIHKLRSLWHSEFVAH